MLVYLHSFVQLSVCIPRALTRLCYVLVLYITHNWNLVPTKMFSLLPVLIFLNSVILLYFGLTVLLWIVYLPQISTYSVRVDRPTARAHVHWICFQGIEVQAHTEIAHHAATAMNKVRPLM